MERTLRISPGPAVVATIGVLVVLNVVDIRVAHASLARIGRDLGWMSVP